MFHEGNGKVCTRVGQELGNSVGGAAGGIGGNGRKQNGTGYAARSLTERVLAANLSWARGCVTYSAEIGRNLVFHWLQPEAVRYFSNEAAGTRITSAYSPR